MIVSPLQEAARKAWWQPGHPGWCIPWDYDSTAFMRSLTETHSVAQPAPSSKMRISAPLPRNLQNGKPFCCTSAPFFCGVLPCQYLPQNQMCEATLQMLQRCSCIVGTLQRCATQYCLMPFCCCCGHRSSWPQFPPSAPCTGKMESALAAMLLTSASVRCFALVKLNSAQKIGDLVTTVQG